MGRPPVESAKIDVSAVSGKIERFSGRYKVGSAIAGQKQTSRVYEYMQTETCPDLDRRRPPRQLADGRSLQRCAFAVGIKPSFGTYSACSTMPSCGRSIAASRVQSQKDTHSAMPKLKRDE
jgi:hypothetical protein